MTRLEYFLKAANYQGVNKPWTKKHWVISLLAITFEEPNAYANDPYPYRLQRKEDGFYYFIDPDRSGDWTKIDTKSEGGTLFTVASLVRLKAGAIPNLDRDVDCAFGDLLFNVIVLQYSFGNKYPFVIGPVKAKALESVIEKRLVDNPEPGAEIPSTAIIVDEYLRFTKAVMQLQGYNYLLVPSASRKTLTRDPNIPKVRAELIEKNKDRLHDPAVAAEIDKVLVGMDRAWVDDDGKDFYINAKSYDNARKKTLLVHGFEKPFSDSDDPEYIPVSLSEGMDYTKMKVYANSIREGSYNRGNETMLGGVEAKKAFRNYQNSFITKEDCGTKLGLLTWMSKSVLDKAVNDGLYYNTDSGPIRITAENAGTIVNTFVPLRSPFVCKVEHTDYCGVCMGATLAANPDALGAAAAGVGSGFLQSFMKMMHVTNVKTVVYDMAECLG